MTIRMSGLNSGLDTDSIVQALVSAYSTTKDNLVKAQTKLSWKQDSWKTMNTSIYSFYTNKLSNMRLSASYNIKTASISNSNYAKVTASSSATSSTQSLKITALAESGYLTGGKISATDTTTKLTASSKLSDVSGLSSLTGGTINITAEDKSTAIEITDDMTIEQFVTKLKSAGVSASFDETNQRFFVSSKTSGADHDFTMTAGDSAGLTALQGLGLYTSNSTDNAEYEKWAAYTDDEIAQLKSDAYDAAKTSNATVSATHYTAYSTALSNYNSYITSGDLTDYDTQADSLADKKAARFAALGDYALKDDDGEYILDSNGDYTYDTDAIEAAGRTTEYTSLTSAVTAQQKIVDTLDGYQATMDANVDYVSFDDEGTAHASYDEDGNAYNDVENTYVTAEVTATNAEIKTEVEAEIDDKVALAKEVVAGTSGATTASTAVRVTGSDATIILNGATFTNNTNNFSINGLTIQATALTGDENVTITTDSDVDGIYDMIKDFFSSYNTLIKSIDTAYNASSASGYEPLTDDEKDAMTDTEVEKWEAKIKDALLRKDTTLGATSSSLKSDMLSSFEIDGKTYSLSSFGISTLGYFSSGDNEKGVYHIDGDSDDTSTSSNTDKLRAAIASDPEAVVSFFSQLSTKVYNDLGKRMASTTISSAYTIYNDKQMSTEYSQYTTKISDWEDKISNMEEYYYSKFTAMETALSKLNSQQSSLSSLLGS